MNSMVCRSCISGSVKPFAIEEPSPRLRPCKTPPIETPLMTAKSNSNALKVFPRRHLLTCEGLSANEINFLLDLADRNADHIRNNGRKRDVLAGRTLINLFFESSTRTQSSFEMAGKRLSADVMNMNVATSSVTKGETLIDTAVTLNAMRPDIIVVRHHAAGAVELLSRKSIARSSTPVTAHISIRRKRCSMH